jgi:signal transduction histidine kinase
VVLDAPTLSLVLFLVYLGNGLLSVVVAWTGRSFPGAWLWVSAQALMAFGALLLFLRPWAPVWVPVAGGNSAYLAATLLFSHSIWKFRFRSPFPGVLYAVVPLAVASMALVVGQPYAVRVEVFSVWMVLGSVFAGTLLIWRLERPFWVANGLTSLPFWGTAVATALRLWANLDGVGGMETPLSAGDANGLYMIGSILISTVTLFGYFMMAGLRAEQIVFQKDVEIEARNRKLIESSRGKDLFFSIIAHDLRGPIGGAARYVRKHLLGKMTGLEAKYTEVETLASALEKTNEFLEKLLWWSRAQLQDWTPSRKSLDLDRVLDQAVGLVRASADLKEIPIEVDKGPHPTVLADPESVQLILGNLLSNAVKFSLPGRTVKIRVGAESGLARLTVQDQGVGMDQSTQDRLFRIEDKLTTHGTSGERGSGLGLLLAQSLAERNGGGIVIESQPGVGTEATLWLPQADQAG